MYVDFSRSRRLVLKPPRADEMVATKNERPNALVRLTFPALSARRALQEDANDASESPASVAAPKRSSTFVSNAKIARDNAESMPPARTNFFLPKWSARPPKRSVDDALTMPNVPRIRLLVAKERPSSRRKTCREMKNRPAAAHVKKLA